MTLTALALTTGAVLVMRFQPEGDPSTELTKVTRSRAQERREATSAESPALDARLGSRLQPKTRIDELSAADEARLRGLEQGDVALNDIPDALRFLRSLPDRPEIREQMVALIRQWAESHASSAANWAEGLPVGGARQELLNGVALVWSNQDLDGTIQWATRLPEEVERNEVLRGVAYEAARTEPLAALEIAVELPTSPENNALIQHAALQWAATSPENAARWAGEIVDEDLRTRVLSIVATAWGESNPVAAAKLAISEIAPGRAQDDAVIGIVQRWVQVDPAAAENWVKSFPAGALRETADAAILKLQPENTP